MSRAVTLLVLASASELTRLRLPFLAARFLFTFTRFIVYIGFSIQKQLQIGYFAYPIMNW